MGTISLDPLEGAGAASDHGQPEPMQVDDPVDRLITSEPYHAMADGTLKQVSNSVVTLNNQHTYILWHMPAPEP